MSFIREIKRRKIVRVAVSYAVTTWALVEIATAIEDPLNLPQWFDTFVIVSLAIGFPVVLLISWAFNLTSKGFVRDQGEAGSANDADDLTINGGDEAGHETVSTSPERILHTEPVSADSARLSEKPSIAVLPFQNMSINADHDYMADGIVEAITAELSRISSFFVIARNSALVFKDRMENATEIGKELGVAYLLKGSAQQQDNRIRITAQLIETSNGTHIWAKHYDGKIDELFDLQDRITASVAGELQPTIRIAEIEHAGRKRPQDQDAYDFTMRAMRHTWSLERRDCEMALDLLRKARNIDPDYPLALSLAGWCHAQNVVYNWSGDIAYSQERDQELAERAVSFSGDDSLVLTVLGTVKTILREFGPARVLLERAVSLDSNAAWAWQRLGWLETYSDHSQIALDDFSRALRLSPLDPMNFNVYAGIGSAYEVVQDYDQAVAHYRRALEERPHAYWINRHLASAMVGAGQMHEAAQAYDVLMSHYPDLTLASVRSALLYPDSMLNRVVANLRILGMPD